VNVCRPGRSQVKDGLWSRGCYGGVQGLRLDQVRAVYLDLVENGAQAPG
jgi:hypothetical protein